MWVGFLVCAVMAQGLVPGGTAHAPGGTAHAPGGTAQAPDTIVRVVSGKLDIRAGVGATNGIVVEQHEQTLYVADMVPVVPGSGCVSVAPTKVSCRTSGVYSVSFALGDGDDTLHLDLVLPANGGAGQGNDGLWGSGADDVLSGGAGNDSIYGNGGADTLYGDSAGVEPSCASDKAKCSDTLYGQSGTDYLNGGEKSDTLYGGPGGDHLDEPTSGASFLDGGTDNDVIVGAGAGMRDMVMYDTRVTDVWVNISGTPYDGVKATVAAHSGGELALGEHDTITGVHDIRTGAGDDVLIGAGGNPALNHGTGIDLCDPDGDDGVLLAPC